MYNVNTLIKYSTCLVAFEVLFYKIITIGLVIDVELLMSVRK